MSRPRKRIALFTGAYNHIADGVSLTLNRLVRYLLENGADVLVFAPTGDTPAFEHAGQLEPLPSVAMPGRPEYRISLGLSTDNRGVLEAFDPTIVHIATPDIGGLQALAWAQRRGLPVVASYHTHFSSYLNYYRMAGLERLMWAYLRWFYGHCTQVYVPTSSMADVLVSHGIRDGLELWPRGVDTSLFHPGRRSGEFRRKHGFSDDEVVISFISRLVIEKGLDVYADTVAALRDEGYPVRALVVGDGPACEMLRERLPRAVFAGHLRGPELATAYASSDVFLFPSETETFGNVTLEAMASGIPTVCANATGSKSLVVDGVTGFLVEPRDTEGFTSTLRTLVTDADRRRAMGEAAHAEALTYSWPLILGRINAYYDSVLS
jgi:glycosyltransferase involved in cell wall biosynthesis